jgi:bifunctional lysine-specific demethylase and histidyl-hydroxylase NO66
MKNCLFFSFQLVPAALNKTIETNRRFREGVPLNLHQNLGIVFSDHDTPERREAIKMIKGMFDQLFENASIDDAVDQMSKKYQQDALPPLIAPNDKPKTVFGQEVQVSNAGEALIPFKVQLGTRIKLLKANILRLVREENVNRIYYHVDNSKVYHEYEPVFVEIDDCDAPAVEALIKIYPEYLQVKDLPLKDKGQMVAVVQDLWDRGLLMSD